METCTFFPSNPGKKRAVSSRFQPQTPLDAYHQIEGWDPLQTAGQIHRHLTGPIRAVVRRQAMETGIKHVVKKPLIRDLVYTIYSGR